MPAANNKILKDVEEFATVYLKENISPRLSFHNFNHTHDVVLATREIAVRCNIPAQQQEIAEIAAWFHDCGYATIYNGHEDISKAIAEKFLEEKNYPHELIKKVLDCIESTRYPQYAASAESMIVCDADLYHFSKPNYSFYEKALRNELEEYLHAFYTDVEWNNINCTLLANHNYFTGYGKNILQKFKEVNMLMMKCEASPGAE